MRSPGNRHPERTAKTLYLFFHRAAIFLQHLLGNATWKVIECEKVDGKIVNRCADTSTCIPRFCLVNATLFQSTLLFLCGNACRRSCANPNHLTVPHRRHVGTPALAEAAETVEPPVPAGANPGDTWGARRVVGASVAGSGVVAVGVGAAFAIQSIVNLRDASAHCTGLVWTRRQEACEARQRPAKPSRWSRSARASLPSARARGSG